MPRFHLNVRNTPQLVVDDEGHDWPDADAALRNARRAAVELLVGAIRGENGLSIADGQIEITDASGRLVSTVTFREMLADRHRAPLTTGGAPPLSVIVGKPEHE